MTLKEARKKIKAGLTEEALPILGEIVQSKFYPATLKAEAEKLINKLTTRKLAATQAFSECTPSSTLPSSRQPNPSSLISRVSVKPFKVLTISWDTRHNCLGRAYILHELARRVYGHATLFGFSFDHFGNRIWEPLAEKENEMIILKGPESAEELFSVCDAQAKCFDVDLVIVSKPRLPSLLLGCLIKQKHNCPMIIDIDDHEMGFVNDREARTFQGMSNLQMILEAKARMNEKPFSGFWTTFSHKLIAQADEILTSNTALQDLYGGLVIPHVRPSVDSGLAQEKEPIKVLNFGSSKIIMFLGTPRKHKGVIELARATKNLEDPNTLLVFIGSFKEKWLEEAVRKESPTNSQFIQDVPFASIADYLGQATIVVLLQDTKSSISKFQLPAKAIDALRQSIQIIATRTTPLTMLADMGFKGIRFIDDISDLEAAIKLSLAQPLSNEDKKFNQRLFNEFLSYDKGVKTLKHAIDNASSANPFHRVKRLSHPFSMLSYANHSVLSIPQNAHPAGDNNNPAQGSRSNIDIILWKQNDVGLFGRRVDMVARYLANRSDSLGVLVFEKPLSTFDLEEMRSAENYHYNLIRSEVVKKVYGLKADESLLVYTPLHPAGMSSQEKKEFVANFIEEKVSLFVASTPCTARISITLWVYPYYEYALDIIDVLSPCTVVADVVDDHTRWPGLSQQMKEKHISHYRDLLSLCDYSVFNCEETLRAIGAYSRSPKYLVPNGADSELFKSTRENPGDTKDLLLGRGRYKAIIGYAGNLESKIDWELIGKISSKFDSCLIVLVGSSHVATSLLKADNIVYTGPLKYDVACSYIKAFDVAIVPHLTTDLTKTMNPLKLYVYAACGIPIISSNVPNLPLDMDASQLMVASSHEEFLELTSRLLDDKRSVKPSKVEQFLSANSWESRLAPLLDIVRCRPDKV